jgi:hypothetical protein
MDERRMEKRFAPHFLSSCTKKVSCLHKEGVLIHGRIYLERKQT